MMYDTMSKEDIEHTRQTFSKAANSKAWKESYGEMCKKTVLRRLCKLIDLNFDTAEQCQAFEDGSAFDVKEKPKEKYQAQDIYAALRHCTPHGGRPRIGSGQPHQRGCHCVDLCRVFLLKAQKGKCCCTALI